MNFTGGNTLPNLGRRNWQAVILAGGLALALSAGALSGVFERDGSPATTAVTRPADAPISPAPFARTAGGPPELVYLVVGSQAEASALESVISADAATFEGIAESSPISVVALTSPEQEAAFQAMLGMASQELMSLGIGTSVVDLRVSVQPPLSLNAGDFGASEPAESIVYVVSSDAEKIALEQQFHEASAHEVDDTQRSVMVVDTVEQEHAYNSMIQEQLMLPEPAFTVVDLR